MLSPAVQRQRLAALACEYARLSWTVEIQGDVLKRATVTAPSQAVSTMRIGIDLGGTKIAAVLMDGAGEVLAKYRTGTPKDDYDGTVAALVDVVRRLETEAGVTASVGLGIPGSIVASTGLVKNANSTWLNGRPLERDFGHALGRPVRCANDANCFAISEATDGAAMGAAVVFGVIIGTGCGGGLVFNGHQHAGPHGLAGEWGHNPLPWPTVDELPGPPCYCGKNGCIETWISGTGLMRDFFAHTRRSVSGAEIVALSEGGDTDAEAALERLEDRMARCLAEIVNILDPDVIVLGGGLSKVDRLYRNLPLRIQSFTFGPAQDIRIVKPKHGDASGVRGAAWLWNE